jgi:hypothetical protein
MKSTLLQTPDSSLQTLLGELTRRGVRLEPRGDALAFFPRHKVPRELREQLQQHKPQLLELLRGETLSADEPPYAALSAPATTVFAPYSVVIAAPELATLDALLLSAIGQAPAPAEILLLARSNRRLRKLIESFGRLPIRFAESPLDARHEFLILLDPRTLLTHDWAARALTTLQDPLVGAAYSDHELLSTSGRTAYPATVTRDDLARSGLVASTVLVRRSALVPLWERGLTTATVLRRMARAGWQLAKHGAPLLFRGAAERDYFDRQELARETVTLFIPLSGRQHVWPELQKFLERQSWPHDQVRIVLCDTSRDARFQRTVRTWLGKSDYADAHWFTCPVPQAGLADAPRDQQLCAVNEILCRIYNQLREHLTTDYVWILEDDVIPPNDVLERLLHAFDEHVATVSAPYRSRFDGRYLVWSRERAGNNGVHQLAPPLGDRPQVHDIRGSGFGCLVARAEVLRQHIFRLPPGETHYDVRFFRELPVRWRRVVDWTCACRHLYNAPRPKCRITRRHLIYHVTPFATNDIWLRNVRQLLKRIDLFNGRRVIAVATGPDLVSPHDVRAAFGTHEVEILTRPNSRELRENATFLPLLECVADPDPEAATFYAHAKGVAKDVLCLGDPLGSRYWRNAMYHELLDDWERIAELLVDHATVGTHRRQHLEQTRIYPDGQSESTWHFAGTFFWFRNLDAFSTTKWRDVWQPTGWGAEAWPGRMFDFDQSACVAYDGLVDHYNPASYDPQIEDDDPCSM